MDATCFSPSYVASRARFRAAADALGATQESYEIGQPGPTGEALTIDAAWIGDRDAKHVVATSSGLHGIEGFCGAAIQTALLEAGDLPPDGVAVLHLHALNPFGFAWLRRVNEENADLNRNMLAEGESYTGSPDGYAELDSLLNPSRAPRRISAFKAKAALKIATIGLPKLKNAVAGGQYDYPKGLFFGGAGPSKTKQILEDVLPKWVGHAERVLHVDFHTGLGPRATYKLFVDHAWGSESLEELAAAFGTARTEPWEPEQGTSYKIRGGLGTWCKALLPSVNYDVLCAEFGTEGILDVIQALHLENRAWQALGPLDPATQPHSLRLRDTFAPSDRIWRDTVVPAGAAIVRRALSTIA